MDKQYLNEIAQEIYDEMLYNCIGNRDNLVCDTSLIPDYGYNVNSEKGLYIKNQVNFLIINNL